MTNGKNKNVTGTNPILARTQKTRNDELGDSKKIGSISTHDKLLDKTPEESGQGSATTDTEQGRAEDRPVTATFLNSELYTIKNFKMSATIPVGQYQNIQPSIELDVNSLEKGTEIALTYINSLMAKYGEHGALPDKTITVKLKSFNEEGVEVDFDPIAHTYTYKGTRLIGATNKTSQYYKDFDVKTIAKACATAWGVEQKDIEEMWATNGEIASSFGTMVHKVLEHYHTHFAMGEKIKAKNGKDNPAMPKHPFLKKLVEDFMVISKIEIPVIATPEVAETYPIQIIPEVFLTDVKQGYCGQADRLVITGDKKCRVQDYKVNIDCEKEDKNLRALAPFNILTSNKLTKYLIQMSVYANILQNSGWTVEGLDVFVFEDEWKKYILQAIKVI